MARAHVTKRGGAHHIWKKKGRLSTHKMYQQWLRENHKMVQVAGTSVAKENK